MMCGERSTASVFLLVLIIISTLIPLLATAGVPYEAEIVVYRSYLGGDFEETMVEVLSDQQGNSYFFGYTNSEEYEYFEPANPSIGDIDIFLAKVDPSGDLVFYALYGGRKDDILTDVCQVDDDTFLLAGYTTSSNLPTSSLSFQQSLEGEQDGFILEITNTGTLGYCSYFGGSGNDKILAIEQDSEGNTIIAGTTSSGNLPLTNASRSVMEGEDDLFLAKLYQEKTALIYSTFWGSNTTDVISQKGNILVVDAFDNVIIAASTESYSYPSLRTPSNRSMDVFLSKFNETGFLVDSYFLNTSAISEEDDFATSLYMDESGTLFVTGIIYHDIRIIPEGQVDSVPAIASCVFVSRVDTAFSDYKTIVLEGFRNDTSSDLYVNSTGHVFVSGITDSLNYPQTPGADDFSGKTDGFLTILKPNLDEIAFSTFLGGYDHENTTYFSVDSYNRIVLGGCTNSIDI
ncbi:MAG: hypothetical protein ACFFDR_09330, partial [Candidatus Thorarchaeota archaeon]